MRRLPAVAFVSFLLIPDAAFAQGGATPVERTQAVTANPFLLLAGWFNVEYERRVSPTTTWGLSGSFVDLEDFDEYRSATLLLRYYPQETALSGLFLGGRTGVYHVRDTARFLAGRPDAALSFGVGVELGYTWLLGSTRNFAISLGGGVTRLFGGDLENVSSTVPNVRLVNVGVAF